MGTWSVTAAQLRSPACRGFGLLLIVFAVTCLYCCNADAESVPAAAALHANEAAAKSFVFDKPDRENLPLAVQLSPYTPPVNEYRRFGDMDKDDRQLALAQITIEAIGRSLDNRIGHAFLAVTEPLRSGGSSVGCKQRFSMKSYLLRCRLKF